MCEKVGKPCICKLSRTLAKTPNLRVLDLANNNLEELPDAVGDLQSLVVLDVSGKLNYYYFLRNSYLDCYFKGTG
jgi:hypothetical protein